MKFEEQVYRGLKKASHKSDRNGKWATPPEVRNESDDIPISASVKSILTQLVKENRAEKKRGYILYRPTGGGGGGIGGFGGKEGYRSPDPYDNDTTPGGRNPEDYSEKTPDPGRNTGDTIRAAVGTMIVGGSIPGAPSGSPSGQTVR